MFIKHFVNNFMMYVSQIIIFYTLSVYSAACHFNSVQSLSHVQLFVTPWTPLQHDRPPCPSPSPQACSNSCPLSQWYHPTISSNHLNLLLQASIFPSIRVFSKESFLGIRWPKHSITTWLNFFISNVPYHIIKIY